MGRVLIIDALLALVTAGIAGHAGIYAGNVSGFRGWFLLSFAFWFCALPLLLIFVGVMRA